MVLSTSAPGTGSNELHLPSQDPWYTIAPPNLEATSPGTVLGVRAVPDGPALYNNASAAFHILYRTTGSRYQPTWAVTSLLIPKKPFTSSSGSNALLSYQIAYNSPSIDYGPSYRIFQPAPSNPFGIPSNHELIDTLLSRGWFVTIPDFEGPRAAFGATVQAGHATLDGIRAVLSLCGNSQFLLLPNSADKFKYALWGYSGGSLASEKAAELQVQYAPELAKGFVGAALGGLVSNIGTGLTASNKTPFIGNLILVLLGTMNEYPEVDTYIRSRLKTDGPQDAAAFLKGREMDSIQSFQAYASQDIYGFFIGGKADLEESEVLRRIKKVEWTLGFHGAPEIPLFIYKAIADEITPIADTDDHVDHYKRYGVSILYERNTAGNHVTEIVNGQDRAIDWLGSVFSGSPNVANQGVEIRDVTVDVYKLPTS
ncbi:LIP-domain-containing protein [Daldinia eschscholtzii]|nr:LIP-domain-containing protein [Daldinia eschscholtzii]